MCPTSAEPNVLLCPEREGWLAAVIEMGGRVVSRGFQFEAELGRLEYIGSQSGDARIIYPPSGKSPYFVGPDGRRRRLQLSPAKVSGYMLLELRSASAPEHSWWESSPKEPEISAPRPVRRSRASFGRLQDELERHVAQWAAHWQKSGLIEWSNGEGLIGLDPDASAILGLDSMLDAIAASQRLVGLIEPGDLELARSQLADASDGDILRGVFRVRPGEPTECLVEYLGIAQVGADDRTFLGWVRRHDGSSDARSPLFSESIDLRALEASLDGTLLAIDPVTGVFRHVGADAIQRWHLDAERLVKPGGLERFLELVPPSHRGTVRDQLAAPRGKAGASWVLRCPLGVDGEVRWVELRGRLVGGVSALARVVAFSIWDITEQRQLEDGLTKAASGETIGQIARSLAHDLNNLLTVIMTHTSIGELDAEEDGALETFSSIREAAEQASQITRQMLSLGRCSGGEPGLVDVGRILERTRNILDRPFGPEVQVAVSVEPNLPRVYAKRGLLEQIVLNLAVNARDAIEESGTVELTARSERSPSGLLGVRIVVADDGEGILPELVNRIFEPFFTTKEPGKGTGLGLSMVRSVVKELGGTVAVKSIPGQGTRFEIRLPAV